MNFLYVPVIIKSTYNHGSIIYGKPILLPKRKIRAEADSKVLLISINIPLISSFKCAQLKALLMRNQNLMTNASM